MERVKLKKAKKKCTISSITLTMKRVFMWLNIRVNSKGISATCSGLNRKLKRPRPMSMAVEARKLAAMIQFLNAIGFLCLVYAFRYGKAIIVSPIVNAMPPVITVIISLAIYQVIPHPVIATGMVMAVIAVLLLAIEPEEKAG